MRARVYRLLRRGAMRGMRTGLASLIEGLGGRRMAARVDVYPRPVEVRRVDVEKDACAHRGISAFCALRSMGFVGPSCHGAPESPALPTTNGAARDPDARTSRRQSRHRAPCTR